MPNYSGIAVHDGWPQYRAYDGVTHALCNAHHLRELLAVIEQDADGQSWAVHADRLLRRLNDKTQAAKVAGKQSLPNGRWPATGAWWSRIITLGHRQKPATNRENPRTRPDRTDPRQRTCLRRLDEYRDERAALRTRLPGAVRQQPRRAPTSA